MAYNGSGTVFISGSSIVKISHNYNGSGVMIINGAIVSRKEEFSLLDFSPLSENRMYNVGLDENNKYPEDYNENYADMLKG